MTYQEFKEAVIRCAGERGIVDYELYYTESDSTSVEIYKEEIKNYMVDGSLGVCFRCIADGRAGYASTENLTGEEAEAIVARALENAGSMESEEEVFLHKKGDVYAQEEGKRADTASGAELIEAAQKLQRAMYAADARVADGTMAEAAYEVRKYALYNSNGIDLEDRLSLSQVYGEALVSDQGEMFDGGKDKIGNLKDFNLEKLAAEAVEDAVSSIGAGSVDSGRYKVIFDGRAFASLLATYSTVFSAESAQKGMSLLKGKEGEKIAADIVTIIDDPMYRDSYTWRTFDGEGVATYAKNVVEKGTLTTLLHNLETAARAGVKSTGNASKASYASVVDVSPFTFYVQPVEGTREELFARAGEGVYVTEVTGLHAGANPITGDFSLSSRGFLIEEGKKTRPVKNFTVSGNFFSLLKAIEGVGTDLEFRGGKWGSPSILVSGLAVAGKA